MVSSQQLPGAESTENRAFSQPSSPQQQTPKPKSNLLVSTLTIKRPLKSYWRLLKMRFWFKVLPALTQNQSSQLLGHDQHHHKFLKLQVWHNSSKTVSRRTAKKRFVGKRSVLHVSTKQCKAATEHQQSLDAHRIALHRHRILSTSRS